VYLGEGTTDKKVVIARKIFKIINLYFGIRFIFCSLIHKRRRLCPANIQ